MKTKRLSLGQRRAIEALLGNYNVRDAAQAAHVGYSSLKRWLSKDRQFIEELDQLNRMRLQHHMFRLNSSIGEGLTLVRHFMGEDNGREGTDKIKYSPSLRLHAAQTLLGYIGHLRDNEMEQRLIEVEHLLVEIKEKQNASN